MKLDGIDIDTTLKELELTLAQEKELSPALRSMIGVLILIVKLLTNRIGLNSSNSSKPPSGDLNRKKKTRKASNKKAGGQKNHPGTTLKQIDDPDEIETIQIDRRSLPKGHDYQDAGFESRQVFDIEITRMVTEYQAQVLVDENGKRFKAPFPEADSYTQIIFIRIELFAFLMIRSLTLNNHQDFKNAYKRYRRMGK
ncbi:MAG: DUF6444 domain-containing protein [Enterobacterales bacterium]|nr:DUF6444 domain-containing protein [Enterobacterales bacterium]